MRSQPISSSPFEVVTPRRVVRLLTLMGIAWIPVLVGRDAVKSAAALWQLADAPNPYFVAAQGTLLYIASPLVVASACLLLLSPGLLLALALDSAKNVGEWVVNGLALSIIVLSGTTQIVQAIAGSPIRENAFVAVA